MNIIINEGFVSGGHSYITVGALTGSLSLVGEALEKLFAAQLRAGSLHHHNMQ